MKERWDGLGGERGRVGGRCWLYGNIYMISSFQTDYIFIFPVYEIF